MTLDKARAELRVELMATMHPSFDNMQVSVAADAAHRIYSAHVARVLREYESECMDDGFIEGASCVNVVIKRLGLADDELAAQEKT